LTKNVYKCVLFFGSKQKKGGYVVNIEKLLDAMNKKERQELISLLILTENEEKPIIKKTAKKIKI
jgi:hypothetical protein